MKLLQLSLSLLLFVSMSACSSMETEIDSINNVLEAQARAWNRGDLGGYMTGYWDDEDLIFTSAKDISFGQKEALQRYQARYPTKTEMGNLTFSDLQTEILCKDVAFTVGHWHLDRESVDFEGRFTLVWKKMNGQWYIIADHSS